MVLALCQVFAKITKLGWFEFQKEDEYIFRTSISDILEIAKVFFDILFVLTFEKSLFQFFAVVNM